MELEAQFARKANTPHDAAINIGDAAATPAREVAKLTPGDALGSSVAGFSSSVAISGDTAVVGASTDDDAGTDSGAAYVFTGSDGGWSQQAKLTADDANTGDNFGFSVAINSDTAVVGAPFRDDAAFDSGSAYVFVRTGGGWSQQAKLAASDAATRHGNFGESVAIDGDTIVVGPNNQDAGALVGVAYVFVRTGGSWNLQATIAAADETSGGPRCRDWR